MTEKKFQNGSMQAMTLSGGVGDGFGGEIIIPALVTTKLRLRLNSEKRKETSPDYWIETPDIDPRNSKTYWAQSGAAWIKTPKAGGDKFFSLNLDRADLPAPVNFAAFKADKADQPKKGEGGELWRFTYSRPRAASRASAQAGADNLLPDDKIAF